MQTRPLTLLSLFALGTLTSLASAAPAASPGASATPKPTTSCATPTAAQCKSDPRWSSVSHCAATPASPDGMSKCSAAQAKLAADPCIKAQLLACKGVIQEAMKNDPARKSAPATKVLKVDGTDVPKDLIDGRKRSHYGKPKPGRELNLVGKNVIARSGLTRAPAYGLAAAAAAKHHRKPAWDANGEKITSCQEYAYEALYDGMRYVDAVGACAGDRGCEVEVAYLPNTPGIARRVLKRKDGKKIPHQLKLRDSGTLVKNDLFSARREFAYAIDPTVDVHVGADGKKHWKKTAEMDAIASALDDGKAWYAFGCTSDCGPRKFKNEWAFHDKLRERNKLSKAEFAEYERRKARFRDLHDIWVVAATEGLKRKRDNEKQLKDRINTPRVAKVSRLDMVSADPFERIDLMNEGVDTVQAARTKAGTPKIAIPNAAHEQVTGFRGTAPAALGVLAAPAATKAPKNAPRAGHGPVINMHCSPSHWEDPNMADLYFGGPASCAIADFLKEEYRRKAAGQKSCLDLGNDDCDWSPETFHGRFVASFPYGDRQQGFEDYCQQWTGGSIKQDNLDAAEKYIEKMKKLVGAALVKVGPYKEAQVDVDGKQMWKLGKNWDDAQSFGDKDWFGGGYDYDVGWHIHPVDLTNDKKICDLTGNSHGNFGIDASLLGNDIDVVDAHASFETNKGNNGISHFDARLQVLGEDLFEQIDANFTTAWAPKDPLGGSMDLPPGWKPSITIMAGPIPVTGSVWGSIYYDAALAANAKLSKTKGACKPDNVEFLVDGLVQPDLGVAGYAEVGAGIGGLLSAGIRGSVTIVSLALPFRASLQTRQMKIDAQNKQATASFDASIDLAIGTLSGYISLYIEILFFEDEWELFSWSGVSDEVALMDPALRADLPLVGWPQ